jgi:type I restriction enzyme S subunit
VTQKNIRKDGLSFAKTKFISEDDHENFYRRSNVSQGDILISMIGANRGMACLVDDARVFSIKNVGLVKANDEVDMRFLLHYLKSQQAKAYVESESRGGAQPFIGLGKLRSFPLRIPSKKEQEQVVDQLDQLQRSCRQLEKLYGEKLIGLTELKQALLQKAFAGELTADAETAIKEEAYA